MGIKERREREKQITRQAILTAALQIAQRDGWPSITIRKVGEQIEYSGPMVYEYFASKDEILLELLQEGFRRLTEVMRQARASTDDLEERLFKIADAYWQFAITNKELYRLMHGLGGVPLDRTVVEQAVKASCETALDALLEWAQAVEIVLDDPLGAIEIVWSLLYGLASLSLDERVESGEQRAYKLMHHALQSQLLAWQVMQKSQ